MYSGLGGGWGGGKVLSCRENSWSSTSPLINKFGRFVASDDGNKL